MGVFEDLHRFSSPDAFSRALKEGTQRYYGSPLPVFIKSVIDTRTQTEKSVSSAREAFIRRLVPANATGEVRRAADRFALISAAGELATECGLTGWSEGEAIGAAQRCFQEWVEQRGTMGSSDMDAAVGQVGAFLEAHGASRFQLLQHARADSPRKAQNVRDRAGFRRFNPQTGEAEYLIFSETFKKEVCGGFSCKAVATELDGRELLIREVPHMTIKRTLPELGSVRVYCVRAAILDGDEC